MRQSNRGVLTETFCAGDIDYERLFRELNMMKCDPHIVLEQAVEMETPHKLTPVYAHRASRNYAVKILYELKTS